MAAAGAEAEAEAYAWQETERRRALPYIQHLMKTNVYIPQTVPSFLKFLLFEIVLRDRFVLA